MPTPQAPEIQQALALMKQASAILKQAEEENCRKSAGFLQEAMCLIDDGKLRLL